MVTQAILDRSAYKISSYIEKYVDRAGAESREEVLNLFDAIQQLFPQWVITSCPMMHPDLHYMSENGEAVLGHSNEFMLANSGINKFFYLVNETDRDELYQCFSVLHEFLESLAPEEHPLYRFVFHYRFRKPDGQYMYLHDEKACVKLKGSGNFYYALFRDLSDKPFPGVKYETFKQEESITRISEYKPAALSNPLSKREQELVTLIKQGLSTKEIAGHLSISHNTVRNIKSRLFEKYNVTNSIELLNKTA